MSKWVNEKAKAVETKNHPPIHPLQSDAHGIELKVGDTALNGFG